MAALARAEVAARLLARGLAVAGLLLLMGLAVATLCDGLLRFFFGRPIDAVRDVNAMIVALAASACIPLAMIERTNITIRFLTTFIGVRTGRFADICAGILVAVTLTGMALQFFVFANQARRGGDVTWILGIPTAPSWFVVDAMLWIALLCQLIALSRDIAAPDRTQPAHGTHHDAI
jgi:TRAP-type C4-dicarboxylate transport system permease small subunit